MPPSHRSSLGWVVTCALAQAAAAQQSIQPILEWGPGLAARNDLLITQGLGAGAVPADVDGDGDLDLVQLYSQDRSGILTVLVNDGRGVFTTRTYPPRVTAAWNGAPDLGVGDIDGDGDLDVVVAGLRDAAGGADRPWVHINDGFGNFVLDNTRFALSPAFRTSCVLADIDRDGDLDAIFTGFSAGVLVGRLELWFNDGRGNFTDFTSSHLPPGTQCESNAAVGDIDGDGFPEIVIGRSYDRLTPKRILWNDGTGTFRTQSLPPNNSADQCFLVDVDLDGDLDVFFKGGQPMLYFNEPTGLRQAPFPPTSPVWGLYPANVGDIDADGDPDIVFSGTIYEPLVLLNDGRGNFREAPGWIHGDWKLGIGRLTFADLDVDGDQDAYATHVSWIQAAIFFNLHRQVWGPLHAARGTTYLLDVRGRRRATLAVALSGAILPQPVSLGALGRWHLDPAMVTLGIVTVGLEGQGALAIPVPNAPNLAGRSFYVQGIDLGTTTPRLEHATNWWGVRIQ